MDFLNIKIHTNFKLSDIKRVISDLKVTYELQQILKKEIIGWSCTFKQDIVWMNNSLIL